MTSRSFIAVTNGAVTAAFVVADVDVDALHALYPDLIEVSAAEPRRHMGHRYDAATGALTVVPLPGKRVIPAKPPTLPQE